MVAALRADLDRKCRHNADHNSTTNGYIVALRSGMRAFGPKTSQFRAPVQGQEAGKRRQTIAGSDHVQQTASLSGKAGVAQQHRRVTTITNAAKIVDTARRAMMNVRRTTTTDTVTTEGAVAIGLAVPQQIQSTVAAVAIRISIDRRAHTAIAARSIAAAIALGHLLKRASTTMMHMAMVIASQSQGRDESTGATKIGTVTGRVTKSAKGTGVIVRIARKIMTMNARRIGRETKTRSAGVAVIARLKKKSATTKTTSTARLDGAIGIVTERSAIGTTAIRRPSVRRRMMWWVR